jgi:predicted ArsR family transcriptional regulator
MSRYQSFEDWRRSKRPHRPTSDAAGDSMAEAIPAVRRRVLRHVERTGGATCDATEAALGLTHQTCSPRFTELAHRGLIADSGKVQRTRSGRNAIVWIITPAGEAELREEEEEAAA